MTLIKSHKILLQPRSRQKMWLEAQCHYQRWCWNRLLFQFKQGLDNGIFWDKNALRYDLLQTRPEWTQDRWQNAYNEAGDHLDGAIKAWLDSGQDNESPKYHRRKHELSCSFPGIHIRLDGRKIRIPKLGWVRMREPLRLHGRVLTVSIKWEADRWWVSLNVDTGVEPELCQGGSVVGVDVGIKTMAVTSNGDQFENPKPLSQTLNYLRFLNKAIARSRKVHGKSNHSNRRERLYQQRRKLYERIDNLRQNAHRQAASAIVKQADAVVVESLNVKGMVRNKKLSRALSDVALGGLLQEIAWQCKKHGVKLIEADRFFPSSKTCSGCGAIKSELTLSEREYACGQCGLIVDRDLNAAMNLRRLGINLIRGETVRREPSVLAGLTKREAEIKYAEVSN